MTLDAMTVLLAVGALSAAVVVTLVFWVSPRATMVIWTVVLFFVPVWIGANIGIFWAAITVVTLLAVIVHGRGLRPNAIDAFVLVFIVLTTALLGLGLVGLSPYVVALLDWLLPYIWGRIILHLVPKQFVVQCIALAAVIAATLALVEYTTGTNFFVLLPGSGVNHATWSTLQVRAGFVRVEGALGHSIALGAVLAMSSAFVLGAPWRTFFKVVALVVLGLATTLTLSRIGLMTFALTVGLSLLFLRDIKTRTRVIVGVGLVIAVLAVVPFIADVLLSAGDEAGGSADYRTDLMVLLGQVQWLGGAGNWESLIVGDNYLGYFSRSVDNALISILLRFGYIPTALMFAVYLSAVVLVLRRGRMNVAGVAIIGQIPSLFVVALITQYGMMLWFCIGLAVTWAVDLGRERASRHTVGAGALRGPDVVALANATRL